MFTCIACTKQMAEGGEEVEGSGGGGARGSGTPNTKDAVKSLTAQVLIKTSSLHFLFSLFPLFFFLFVKTNKIISPFSDLPGPTSLRIFYFILLLFKTLILNKIKQYTNWDFILNQQCIKI